MNTTRRVTRPFDAKHLNARRRERFVTGELLTVVYGPESAALATFTRINGIRQSRDECRYVIEPAELNQNTEIPKELSWK